jgi:hypothetical protein
MRLRRGTARRATTLAGALVAVAGCAGDGLDEARWDVWARTCVHERPAADAAGDVPSVEFADAYERVERGKRPFVIVDPFLAACPPRSLIAERLHGDP